MDNPHRIQGGITNKMRPTIFRGILYGRFIFGSFLLNHTNAAYSTKRDREYIAISPEIERTQKVNTKKKMVLPISINVLKGIKVEAEMQTEVTTILTQGVLNRGCIRDSHCIAKRSCVCMECRAYDDVHKITLKSPKVETNAITLTNIEKAVPPI